MAARLRFSPFAALLTGALLTWLAVLPAPAIAQPATAQPETDRPAFRPADGLLQNEALQSVVDAQLGRDGAALITFLQDDDPAVRARAAFALGSVQDTAAIPVLVDRLTDPTARVRADAAFALGQMPGTVPSEPLFALLDGDSTVAALAMEALGKTGDAASLRRLVQREVAPDQQSHLALAIARYGLRDVHDSLAVNRLVDLLTESGDEALRRDAAYYVGRMTDPAPWQHRADAIRTALRTAAPGEPAAMHLVLGVARLKQPTDDALLFDWLRTATDWRTRVNVARALSGRTDRPAVVAELIKSLNDSIPHVAITAAQSLSGAALAPSQTEPLMAWVEAHPDRWRVVGLLLQCIARGADDPVGRPFVRSIVRRYASQQNAVAHAAAVPALASLKTETADPALTAAAQHEDPRVAAAALSALAGRWDRRHADAERLAPDRVSRYFEAFAHGVFRADIATLNAAAPALADSAFQTQGATGILLRTLKGLEVPDDVEGITVLLRALGTAPASPRIESALRDFLSHEHPVLRETAADALETLTGDPASPSGSGTVETPPIDWMAAADLGRFPRLVLNTNRGRIVVRMDVEQAPQTATTIARLAADGAYDGVPFHRVVPNFVVQGGDVARGDGWGGPGFFIRSEFTRIPYRRGTAGIASAGKDTEGSQYFLTHSMQPHLDGRYTAFGTVVEGAAIVDQLLANDRVESATIE